MKAKEVITDLPVELQVSPTYIPPLLDEACHDTAGLWPERLLPQLRALPPMSELLVMFGFRRNPDVARKWRRGVGVDLAVVMDYQ